MEFKPFDKVLVRNFDCDDWTPAFFWKRTESEYVMLDSSSWSMCIPYEGNEDKLGSDKRENTINAPTGFKPGQLVEYRYDGEWEDGVVFGYDDGHIVIGSFKKRKDTIMQWALWLTGKDVVVREKQ